MTEIPHAPKGTHISACRACGGPLDLPFCDLGEQPLANAYLSADTPADVEARYPLAAMVCGVCRLVQLNFIVDPTAIFTEYPYLSSQSATWLAHAKAYVASISERLALGPSHFVVELASNDGYLLQYFVQRSIRCLGVEPARNMAALASQREVSTLTAFFGRATAREIRAQHGSADLIIANNVLAHVPDLGDFVGGISILLSEAGTATIEVPHVLALIEGRQFDTIYHEHYAYWSLHAMEHLFGLHGLAAYDVERLPTHGGSLRVYVTSAARQVPASAALQALREREADAGVGTDALYRDFNRHVALIIERFRDYLAEGRNQGRRIVGYGAAAKGNTFLNAVGAASADILAVADANPLKAGRLLPGTRIPVVTPGSLPGYRPDDIVVLPWNLLEEIRSVLVDLGLGSSRLVTAIPTLTTTPVAP